MKIRCQACGRVVKIAQRSVGQAASCPECDADISSRTTGAPNAPSTEHGETNDQRPSKGTLPTHRPGIEAIGCVITFVILSAFGAIANVAWESSSETGWLVAVIAVAVVIGIGVLFHNLAKG